MNLDEKIFYRVRYLICKSLDGQIEENEAAEMDRLIVQNPRVRRYYVEFLQIHALLRTLLEHTPPQTVSSEEILDARLWRKLAQHEQTAELIPMERPCPKKEEPVEKSAPSPQTKQLNKFSLYAVISSAAVFFLLLVYTHLRPMIFKPVAAVAGQIQGAVLFQDSTPYMEPELYPGSYLLDKGLVELAFADGARVIVEAPSEFVIENASRIYLLKGQLAAVVENKQKPFVVRTLNSKVIDLGTEFGVGANADGTMETHVFQGKVRLESRDPAKQTPMILENGQAVHADSAGSLTRKQADPLRFVRQEEFNVRKQAAKGVAYYRWQEHVYQIHRDPALVAHYTFDQDPYSPDLLKNQAPATRVQLNGILEGQISKPKWAPGRWIQKTALFFDRSAVQRVRIPADSRLSTTGPITLAAWIKMEEAPADFIPGMHGGIILSNGQEGKLNYHLSYGLYYESHMMIYMRAQGYDYHTRGPAVDLTMDQWHFLAVTHDNNQVSFYIDGKLMKTVEKSFANPPVLADLLIGGMEAHEQPKYRFNGFIDEVLIFSRVLSEVEMQVLYESGKP